MVLFFINRDLNGMESLENESLYLERRPLLLYNGRFITVTINLCCIIYDVMILEALGQFNVIG